MSEIQAAKTNLEELSSNLLKREIELKAELAKVASSRKGVLAAISKLSPKEAK